MVRMEKLKLEGFRVFSDTEFRFHEHLNVLVGINGSGKSSVLYALATGLSHVVSQIRGDKSVGKRLKEPDIRNGMNTALSEYDLVFGEENIHWKLMKGKRFKRGSLTSEFAEMREKIDNIMVSRGFEEHMDVPLFVLYSVNRAVTDVPLRIRKRHSFDELAAYDEALTGAGSRFRVFFEWFRRREDLENEQRVNEDDAYRDRQLSAVREAIETFTRFTNIRIRRNPLQMEVHKGEQVLNVNQLSDGEKCALAMVGDLARRLAIANPCLDEPLQGDGIVMIDEVELHLHPGWQYKAVDALTRTFPNCQFVLTTHSPQVISNVKPESLLLLQERDGEVVVEKPNDSYGFDVNYILEVLMGTDKRDPKIDESMDELFQSISENRLDESRKQLESLRREIGSPPDLVRAETMLHRREILRSEARGEK